MDRDILFILPPGLEDNDRREFCPECTELAGLLALYPFIRDALDIRHVGIQHPRKEIVEILGDGRYNAPTLVLVGETDLPQHIETKRANERVYLDSMSAIAKLFAARYGLPNRRGDS
ncbi:MAG: DUF3088 family protein [Pseudomonadota bacterium]